MEGTERLTEVESTPHRFWSNPETPSTEDRFQGTGVLVDLDLDDVPATEVEFVAGAVSVDGPDAWWRIGQILFCCTLIQGRRHHGSSSICCR
ncbi:hypothetical protein [Rhodococcus koreensis]